MIEPLESRDLFAVAPDVDAAPLIQPQPEIAVDAAASSSTRSTAVVVATNDLGPDNIQKKHVSNTLTPPASTGSLR